MGKINGSKNAKRRALDIFLMNILTKFPGAVCAAKGIKTIHDSWIYFL